jgi:hypothetical protein
MKAFYKIQDANEEANKIADNSEVRRSLVLDMP